MRRIVQWTWIALLAGILTFFGSVPYAGAASPNNTADPSVTQASAAEQGNNVGYLENIAFEKLKGKERLTLMTSKQSGVNVENRAGGILVRMDNMFVPEDFRKPWGEGKLSNLVRVVPEQKTANGKPCAIIAIDLKERIPYGVSQQGQNVLIDFNVSSLEEKMAGASPKDAPAINVPVKDSSARVIQGQGEGNGSKSHSDRLISLDFQDANIKAVLRLLSEEGGVSIVSGEDVKGNVTVNMKKVPWEEALDVILKINGLVKKQMGSVITVLTVERSKKDEADRLAGEDARVKAELTAKKAEQELMEEKGKLAQISIEAKIVEANDDFVRKIGVTWGGGGYGNSNGTGWLVTGGSNPVATRGKSFSYPSEAGYLDPSTGKAVQSVGVNFPSVLTSPTLGLVVGGAWGVLEAQLQALETNNEGKVISTPKVTTMDNVKATIKQGQEVPFITVDKDGNRSISFKEAVLKLEVKPKITPDGKISMEIKATNDSADYAKAADLGGNPPINKSEVESKIVVQDGDTIVIGGIVKTEDSKGVSGIPWLSKIPVLGWLFKTESITKTRRQIMVFVTPKIIKADAEVEKPSPTGTPK